MMPALVPASLALLLTAPVALAQQANHTTHVVKTGETLNGIANRAGVSNKQIIEANGLKSPYTVWIGQKLKIPAKASVTKMPTSSKTGTSTATASKPRATSSLANVSSYVVRSGDTLSSVAARAQIPRILIAEANGLTPPYSLRSGQKLTLPRTRHHTVKEGDTGFSISYDYGVSWEQIAIANGLDRNAKLTNGKKLLIPTLITSPAATSTSTPTAPTAVSASTRFAWPVTGPVRRGFIPRASSSDYHDGIDITAARGTAARSIAAGTVIFAQPEPEQFGQLVVVDHGDGWHSAYGSLERITVKVGHKVAKGERVGLIGNTSVTKKTELHFELRKDGKPINPLNELPKAP